MTTVYSIDPTTNTKKTTVSLVLYIHKYERQGVTELHNWNLETGLSFIPKPGNNNDNNMRLVIIMNQKPPPSITTANSTTTHFMMGINQEPSPTITASKVNYQYCTISKRLILGTPTTTAKHRTATERPPYQRYPIATRLLWIH